MYRTGIGWDVHSLVEGRELWLGGVQFKGAEKGLEGHSDADVVCHAICDALLGALALGDIGEHFPDTDPKYKDFPGTEFLKGVRDMVTQHGYRIANVDCVVMSDAVRLGNRKKEMQTAIASHLGIESGRVGVKATTWEGHGAVGRGEVIAAQAVVAVTKTGG
ncbi:MAG: 2-C-methyl-D-erythritol 2,4-cyclodiphosphate synthase [Candidatus Latescibacterota bacterium]|nr:MAG: 2-C-methyl-D-erythritol 2,4-cyclodiphosphate synthase [Candidatus Latescibacterota bacterium]